eukprot:SAG31_NODE_1312_length_8861_cov_10.803127_5_plen_57_part_00
MPRYRIRMIGDTPARPSHAYLWAYLAYRTHATITHAHARTPLMMHVWHASHAAHAL